MNTAGSTIELDANGRLVRRPGVAYRVQGTLTRAEGRWLDAMRNSQFFLVKNDGAETGERWRCGNCGASGPNAHDYFTALCIELPYRGLDRALYRYVQATHDEYAAARLFPFIPQLGQHGHRETARRLRPKEPGAEFYAIALGYAEPITEARAQEFLEAISTRAGRQVTI